MRNIDIQMKLKVHHGIETLKNLVIKVKRNFEKASNVKNNDKSKKHILRGEINATYNDRFLSKSKENQLFRASECSHCKIILP